MLSERMGGATDEEKTAMLASLGNDLATLHKEIREAGMKEPEEDTAHVQLDSHIKKFRKEFGIHME